MYKLVLGFALAPLWALAQIPAIHQETVPTDARVQLFQEWVTADPASVGNRTLLAGAFLQKTRETNDFGYLDRASKLVDQVLQQKPDYEARRLRSMIELTRHQFRTAADHARELTASVPSDPQNWGVLGDALLEMGQYPEAHTAFQKMVALRPSLFSYNRLAYFRFLTGDVEGAISMMRDAVKAGAEFPENKAWCLVELGHLYFKTGNIEAAQAAYSEAAATFPALHSSYAGLGSIAAASGDAARAVEFYKHAQAISPMVQYAGVLHDLYTALGKTTEAKQQ
ncbi:MAG: tetratricopeptide repeat protein, partial [Acidobacteriota bacterium]